MKERLIVKCVVAVLAVALIFGTGNTDLIYVGCTVLFFGLCLAYAAWCEKL